MFAISITMKSVGNKNLSTLIITFSTITNGVDLVIFDISITKLVFLILVNLRDKNGESGMTLMLEPKSAKADMSELPMVHGIVKLFLLSSLHGNWIGTTSDCLVLSYKRTFL